MKIDDRTAFEALQLGAATCPRYDQEIKAGKLPYGVYWTSTATAYMTPGIPFGKTASFTDPNTGEVWQVAVPKKYQGKKDCALLANIGAGQFSKKDNTVILKPKAFALKPMSSVDGCWRLPDEFGFPSGKESDSTNQEARRLWRRVNEGYVGLLARDYYGFGDDGRDVNCGYYPSDRYGVLTEEQIIGSVGNLKPLALDAEIELTELRGTVKEERLTRITALVEAAKQ